MGISEIANGSLEFVSKTEKKVMNFVQTPLVYF